MMVQEGAGFLLQGAASTGFAKGVSVSACDYVEHEVRVLHGMVKSW